MSYTLPLTFELQQERLDVVKVYQAVDTVIESLQECRGRIEKKHDEWYSEAVSFASKIGTLPCIKRIAGQQTLRANYKVDDPSEYYKLSLTIPLLDRVITELKSRFTIQHRIHSFGCFILPAAVVKDENWKEHVREFSLKYKSDLPSVMNLETEMDQWKIYWRRNMEQGKVPDTISSTLTTIDPMKEWFPNIYRILCLVAVVPASSNSCERSISKL